MKEYLPFIRTLIQHSRRIILHYFQKDLPVELKADHSPVTLADREAETAMRNLIISRFPAHGILGEEFGHYQPEAEFQWILDPIDGTKSFIAGVPLFGTLVALQHRGTPLIGALDLPVFRKLVVGDNTRTTLNGKPVRVRECQTLAQAVLLTTDYQGITTHQNEERFRSLISRVRLFRTWGDCYGYYLLVAGHGDIMIDPIMAPWDSIALVPIIRGAGGVISDYQGDDPMRGNSIIATQPILHPQVIAILNPP